MDANNKNISDEMVGTFNKITYQIIPQQKQL